MKSTKDQLKILFRYASDHEDALAANGAKIANLQVLLRANRLLITFILGFALVCATLGFKTIQDHTRKLAIAESKASLVAKQTRLQVEYTNCVRFATLDDDKAVPNDNSGINILYPCSASSAFEMSDRHPELVTFWVKMTNGLPVWDSGSETEVLPGVWPQTHNQVLGSGVDKLDVISAHARRQHSNAWDAKHVLNYSWGSIYTTVDHNGTTNSVVFTNLHKQQKAD